MNIKLIEASAEKLLEKFGAGNHIPGSGSAAAFQGMVSAQLILTVIDLTSDEKRGNDYSSILPQIATMSSEINNRIYPKLQTLFQQDSEQFHSAIQLRIARDNEKGFKKGRELDQQAKDALKPATETPIEIAKLCVELAEFATFLFNKAFRAARGDSSVALHGAAAAVGGCLSIVRLNLLSINDEDWMEKIILTTKELKDQYERSLSSANSCLFVLGQEAEAHRSLQREIKILQSTMFKSYLTDKDIEEIAKKVQNVLWNHKDAIWKKKKPENAREVLQPKIAFEELLNYKVVKRDSLDTYNILAETFGVAGIIDNNKKAVGISKKFPTNVQNYTLAHELGHALMHKQAVLHRDRPMDSYNSTPRDLIEMQADKFASYFLMPTKQVKMLFEELFSMKKFFLNEDNVFALTGGILAAIRSKCRNLRDLSRIIASSESFYGAPFKSIAEVFNVSTEAMAIRLEEIGLVEFESAVPASVSF